MENNRNKVPPIRKPKLVFDNDSTNYNLLRNKINMELINKIIQQTQVFLNQNNNQMETVFQMDLYDDKYENDKKRKQRKLSEVINNQETFQQIFEEVERIIQEFYPSHQHYKKPKILVSFPNCGKQMMHADFNTNQPPKEPEHTPLAIFVGLMNGTKLNIITNNENFD